MYNLSIRVADADGDPLVWLASSWSIPNTLWDPVSKKAQEKNYFWLCYLNLAFFPRVFACSIQIYMQPKQSLSLSVSLSLPLPHPSSPLSSFFPLLTRQREGSWLPASPKASKCFALVSGSSCPGIFQHFHWRTKSSLQREGGLNVWYMFFYFY